MGNNNTYELEIATVLKEIGMPAHLHGYRNVTIAISMVINDMRNIVCVTKGLYPEVAKRVGSSPSRVEKTIRDAIERTFENIPSEKSIELFGKDAVQYCWRPTNKEFIAQIATSIKLNELRSGSQKEGYGENGSKDEGK